MLLFKTMEMTNKNGKSQNIQVNQLIPSDLLIKPSTALLPKIHKISKELVNLLMLFPSTTEWALALSGNFNKQVMHGTSLWLIKVWLLSQRNMPTWRDGVSQSLDGKPIKSSEMTKFISLFTKTQRSGQSGLQPSSELLPMLPPTSLLLPLTQPTPPKTILRMPTLPMLLLPQPLHHLLLQPPQLLHPDRKSVV